MTTQLERDETKLSFNCIYSKKIWPFVQFCEINMGMKVNILLLKHGITMIWSGNLKGDNV